MAEDLKVNSNTDILEFKRKFNLFVSNYDKGEFDGDFEITGDLTVDGDVEIKGDLVGAETQIANAVSDYITAHPFAPQMLEGQDISPDDISATGRITGAEIIENMSGYNFVKGTEKTGITREFVYAGVVKTGNKITFVVALNLTRTDTVADDVLPNGAFVDIPASVWNKIYSTSIGHGNYVDLRKLQAFSAENTSVELPTYFAQGTGLMMYINKVNDLELNTKYYLRYEVTLLLSDNLIPVEE